MSASDAQMIPVTGLRKAGAKTFGILFLLESLVRAFNSSVLSIQAYDLLHKAQSVSILSTGVSSTVLCFTLCMPLLFRRMRRRYVYTIGCLMLLAGSLALATFTVPGQVIGVIMRNCGSSIANVTLQLYILDNIRKADLTTSEPLRLAVSTVAWVAGPFTGVYLYQEYGPVYPQLAAIFAAAILLAVFWYLRLHENPNMPSGTLKNFNPLGNAKHFMIQPRLRLAWAIAFGRSCFWGTFFTYGPLMIIQGGFQKKIAGLIISLSQLFLLAAFIFGTLAKRIGVRGVISLCYAMMTVASITAGLVAGSSPLLASAFLLVAALFASGIDSVGGIPFLRAVKPRDRQRMTAVYRTFLECSDLIPSAIFIVALHYFNVPIVFIILGAFLGVMSILVWRFLPKSM